MISTKVKWIGGAAIVLVALLGFKFWLRQHDASLKATSENVQIEKDRAQSELDRQAAIKAKEAEIAAIKKPADAVRVINKYVPLPVPVNIPTTDAPLPNSLKELPNAPINKPLVIPPEDIVPAGKAVLACEECKINLASAQADNKRLQTENDNLKTALKGGKWFQRLGRQLKTDVCAGVGAGTGAAVGAAKNGGAANAAKYAAVGAVGGAIVCTLL